MCPNSKFQKVSNVETNNENLNDGDGEPSEEEEVEEGSEEANVKIDEISKNVLMLVRK
jgi:hypothetical protein